MIKQKTGDSLASYYPNPELMIFKANNALPILVYRIELSSVSPLFSYEVFISATDGSLVYKNEMIYDVSPAVGMAERILLRICLQWLQFPGQQILL